MNIIVCAKQVVDVSEIKIDKNTNKPILQGIEKKVSDFDKNAMEAAIKIKEDLGGKVTVLSVAPEDAKERIKELLAMGADEAVLVAPPEDFDYGVVSNILAGAIKKIGEYDMIICGEASVDMFSGQMGPRIASLLDIPQITYANSVTAESDKIKADRDLGDRTVKIESPYPVLVTVTKEINEPRLPSLMQILGAANKPLNEWSLDDLDVGGLEPKLETLDVKGVSMERKNVIYEEDDIDQAVKKLVDDLAKEGVLG